MSGQRVGYHRVSSLEQNPAGAATRGGGGGEGPADAGFGISRETVYQYLRAGTGPTTGGSGCHGQ